MDPVLQRVRADIAGYGWHVGKIPGDERAPSWAFTIGLHESFGHAELVTFGLDLETAHRLLNQIGLFVKRGQAFADGERAPGILETHTVAFRRVAPRWLSPFLGNVAWYYGSEDTPVLQCFWPDASGRHPWEEGFDPSLGDLQPLLYETAVETALSPALAQVLREEDAL
ncbi:MAG: DUF4262 domain-containing protein [Myxococcota bacterium]